MTLTRGVRLGSYEIVDHLGTGGMGEVYRARDPNLGRDVAVKVLDSSGAARPRQRERFLREARAASALNHPNIVTVHEIGADRGIDFIVMEFVRGQTLHALMAAKRLSLADVLRIAGQMADGLSQAHASGIVHRDLKPANVMVTGDRLVKILDFGLAKVGATDEEARANQVTEAALTQPGTSMGTLGYMSPEQALGAPVDARSDVFSFGVILFEMLAGRRPFTGKTMSEVLRALHFETPPLDQLRPETPAVVLGMVRRCLAKEPADRYASMEAVAEVLHTLSASAHDAPIVAVSAAIEAGPRPSPARRTRVAAVAVLAIAVLVAAGWFFRPDGRRGETVSSRLPGASMPPSGMSAVDLTAEGARRLVREDRDADLGLGIDLLEQAIQADAGHAPAYAYLGRAYLRRYKSSPDPQWLQLARDRAERAVALDGDLAIGHLATGLVSLETGDTAAAVRHLRRAVELDPLNPHVQMGLGQGLAVERQTADAEAAFRKAVDLGKDQWRPYMDLGQFLYQQARYDEAIATWERGRALTPDNLLVLRNLGAAYYRAGRFDEAASTLQRALEVRPSGPVYTNLGNIYFQQGRHTEAVAAFEKALEQDANNYAYWGNLADAYRWAAGRRPDAAPAYRRATELLVEQIARKPDDADLRTRNALYLSKAGDLEAARAELGRVEGQALSAQMHFRVAVARELLGERTRALDSLARALDAGYPAAELGAEPELMPLRADPRYHRLVSAARE